MLKMMTIVAILLGAGVAQAKTKPMVVSKTMLEVSNLIKKMDMQSEFSIAQIRFSPAQPKQGDKVTILIELSTDFESNKNIKAGVQATLSGQKIRLNRRAGNLWTSLPIQIHQAGKHSVEVAGYIEDIEANKGMHEVLKGLLLEIAKLQVEYDRETNPTKKDQIQQVLASKNSQKLDIENLIEISRKPVANKTKDLIVGVQKEQNSTYPRLVGCAPDAGEMAGGVEVVLSGVNMSDVQSLTIGDVTLSSEQLQVTDTAITFVTPVLSKGIHDISIVKEIGQQPVATTLENAFYAGEVGSGAVGGQAPVAIAGYPRNVEKDMPIQLDGTMSYDEAGGSLTYLWEVVSRPFGAQPSDSGLISPTTATPTFIANFEGNYIVSLKVSNGTKESQPSWTIVTVGPKGAISVTPSYITGTYTKSSPFVGMFKICNNLRQDGKYQIYLNQVSLLSGSNRGTILANSCLSFQFVSHYKPQSRSFTIPISFTGPINAGAKIDVSLVEVSAGRITLHTMYNPLQWTGETDLALISDVGVVPILGTHDEVSETLIEVRNSTSFDIYVPNEVPTFTYLDESSDVFEITPNSGFIVPAMGSEIVTIKVKPTGIFSSNYRSEALLSWALDPYQSEAITAILSTTKHYSISSSPKVLDFGDIVMNGTSAPQKINLLEDFFGAWNENWLLEVESITASLEDCFKVDDFWPGKNFIVGVQPNISAMNVDILPYFKPAIEGLCEGEMSFKLKGVQTPVTYQLKGTGIAP